MNDGCQLAARIYGPNLGQSRGTDDAGLIFGVRNYWQPLKL